MYGTDLEDNKAMASEEIKKHAHEIWLRDWKYLTTADSLQSPYVVQKFKGLQLPKTVIDKIYHTNPEKYYFSKKK